MPPGRRWPHSRACVKKTRYFEEQVLRKRPYIREEWCEEGKVLSDTVVAQKRLRLIDEA